MLWKNILRMKYKFQNAFDITPRTWLLPDDFKKLQKDKEMNDLNNKNKMYIAKPVASSCGRGI